MSRPIREVWEISDENLVRNEDLRSSVSVDRIKRGLTVWVEYTIVPYTGKTATKKDDNKFDPGCTLRLLSIGMLSGTADESRYNFESLRKRRRMGDKR